MPGFSAGMYPQEGERKIKYGETPNGEGAHVTHPPGEAEVTSLPRS